ncbi:MAG: N-6 DNA methylase [Bacteroidales bacterium]|nr:N-6 DNA methylase [Bacteroidales bacterium]
MDAPSNIESNYSKRISIEHRKKFAQFFTPQPIADLMALWLLKNNCLQTVLEPAFGLGVFSRALLSKKQDISIKGFEIDKVIFDEAHKHYANCKNIRLLLQDYMYNDWENKYDGIICNPPYFKFHDYDNKSVIKEIEHRLSCKLNGLTNLYTLFLLKSVHQLNPNGRSAYIIPSEFLNSDYGTLVKSHLIKTKTLRHVIVFDFEENIFDDALTTACIILCANDSLTENIQFSHIRSTDDLQRIQSLIETYPNYAHLSEIYNICSLNPNIKWRSYYQEQQRLKYHNLVPFSKYAKVMRGIATGANDYFTFNKSKAEQYGIDEKYLLPCICKCADAREPVFSETDFTTLRDNDKKVFLLNALNADNENVSQYINKGVCDGINEKYLTASRNPWYALEKRPPSPIWVSVFNRNGLRFVRNKANISNLTTFHCVYPQHNIFSTISEDLLFAYLLTDTARTIFEDNAREYGNGLYKFEPNDLNKGMMVDLDSVTQKRKEDLEHLAQLFGETNDYQHIKKIDELLTAEFSV